MDYPLYINVKVSYVIIFTDFILPDWIGHRIPLPDHLTQNAFNVK